jgi:hypothetical protein
MGNYKLDILGMSVVRWASFGEIATQNGFIFLHSGYNSDQGPVCHDGVGLLLSKTAKRSLTEWQPISNYNSTF